MEETFTGRRETLNCFYLLCPRGSKLMKSVLSFISFLFLYFPEYRFIASLYERPKNLCQSMKLLDQRLSVSVARRT